MPNNQDDPQYPRQQASLKRRVQAQATPSSVKRMFSTIPSYRQQSYQPQQQIHLPAPSDADENEPQRQIVLTDEHRYDAYTAANAPQQQDEQLGITDFVLFGVIIFLIFAILFVGWLLIQYLPTGISSVFTSGILKELPWLLLIYAACIVVAYLRGRYLSEGQARRENTVLKSSIDQLNIQMAQLRDENTNLQQKLSSARAAAQAASVAKAAPQPVATPAPPPVVNVVAPKPIEPIQPPPSVYESSRDPDNFNERERQEHPHEKVLPENGRVIGLSHGWHIIGASRRGYGHAYEGKYREDDFYIRKVQVNYRLTGHDIVLVSIADGVSSKPFSRRGARAAVIGASDVPEKLLQNLVIHAAKSSLSECEAIARDLLLSSLQSAYSAIQRQSVQDSIPVDDMQSTLMVFLALPFDNQHLFVASAQIGDGALFAFEPQKGKELRTQWRWLQQPQIQSSGNEVQPFMRTGPEMWRNYLQVDMLDNAAFVMGMTDGTADDIEPLRPTPENPDPDPFFLVNDFYKHIEVSALKNPQPANALVQFLAYKKKQSFDDRTVVCLYR